MRILLAVLVVAWLPALAFAQGQSVATLRITVADPSGAVIVGAHVTVKPLASGVTAPAAMDTGARGDAVFSLLDPGRYAIHIESPGFADYDARDVRLRSGENRRDVKLAIAKIAETVQVGRDPRERASDPRSDAFATVLGQDQINELPDDPDEFEQALKDMAGPGATLRVNGFRGGKLPPKDQIQQIRFRRNMFAADTHEAGFISIDITTKPGLESWRGSTNAGFRDSVLNAKNAFAPVKGDERNERYGVSLSGPLWAKHTSLALSVDGTDAFDSKTIVAALPAGYFADSIRKPNDALNASARLEHALTKTQVLRAEAQRNHTFADNLGVGDFDLVQRAYSQTRTEDVFRLSTSGSMRKSLFNEFRFQFRADDTSFTSASNAPAVLVLNAFNSGGAQMGGSRGMHQVDVADDLDIAVGKHAFRTGFLVEAGTYRTDELRNATGTFTFASLDAYSAGLPTTFTRNVGDPHVEASQIQSALYFQDDYRARKDLTISGGVRQEMQSHVGGVHIAPRGGIAWSPFKSGKTTVRAGGGIFFDWFDAQSYEQALQLDGTHQHVETIVQPGYPNPTLGGRALALPPGRVQLALDLAQPMQREAMAGVEQTLPGEIRLNTMYIRRRGSNHLRGVNINAPLANGVRPFPDSGPITQVESIAESQFDGLSINLNYAQPARRLFIAANYMLSRSTNDADSLFSLPANSYDLAAERGPALGDARHRFMSLANLPLPSRFRLATSVRIQSALPYNITTGRDDNGDTISNDRPAGVTRNTGRGSAQVDLGARLSWSMGFGTRSSGGVGGPQVRIVRGGDADPLGSAAMGGDMTKRYSIELYAQSYNLLNRLNALNFSGVMTSPFFGQATSAAPPRRVEIGARISF
ncbi:MAG: carboxypeptidase regulatory-like domain-containing protein [Acidobacteria bacterium]|nr:carboxypeptidase regulatory-like domain-containing protein [Acidobacteriota bacterium]